MAQYIYLDPRVYRFCRCNKPGLVLPNLLSGLIDGLKIPWTGLLIRNLGIVTGGNWLKCLVPILGIGSLAYSQSGNWFSQELPLVGIDWNICSKIWDLILQLIPRVGIDSHRNSHWWELIEIFNPKFGILFFSLFPEWELIPTGIPTPTPCPNPFCIMQSKCIWINWNNKNPDMRIYEVLMHSWSELINV